MSIVRFARYYGLGQNRHKNAPLQTGLDGVLHRDKWVWVPVQNDARAIVCISAYRGIICGIVVSSRRSVSDMSESERMACREEKES